MVSCCSCGRIIVSGTIRCSRCSSPFHLSCSHRYQISQDGVFNVCCGNDNIYFQRGASGFMRNRGNKRRQAQRLQPQQSPQPLVRPQQQQPQIPQTQTRPQDQQQQQQQESSNEALNGVGFLHAAQNDNAMRFAKVQKVEPADMTYNDKVPEDDDPEVLELNIDNENLSHDDSVEIIEETVVNEEEPRIIEEPRVRLNPLSNLNNSKNNKITLETVWDGIASLQSSISNISNSLDSVSTQLNTIDPRIVELESTLNTIKTKTANFENVQNDVSGLRDELTRLTNELEELKTQEKPLDISNIFVEMKEREMKSRNILIYNVPEDNLRISQDYSTVEDINKFNALVAARDNSRAREILSHVPDVDLDEIETRRLGRMRQDWNRPLRVILLCKEDVIQVMRNRGLVPRPYTVKTDLTRYQQNKIRALKEELATINDPDNPSMTIKFISGEPKIIPIRRDYMKGE